MVISVQSWGAVTRLIEKAGEFGESGLNSIVVLFVLPCGLFRVPSVFRLPAIVNIFDTVLPEVVVPTLRFREKTSRPSDEWRELGTSVAPSNEGKSRTMAAAIVSGCV